MPLIKQRGAEELTRSALVLEFGDLKAQATRIIDEARREAAAVVHAARVEADTLVAAADERGFTQGFERGQIEGREAGETEGRLAALADGETQLAAVTEAWTKTLEAWETQFAGMLLAAREEILEFAIAMGRKVTLRTAERHPDVVKTQVAETLGLLCRPAAVTVVIHPEDRVLVEEMLPAVLERLNGCTHAELRDDASITRGGCIVRSGEGEIDATIETQLDRIVATLVPDVVTPGATPEEDDS